MRILHTADLQIGARFTQFAGGADTLRRARTEALERVLGLAEDRGADAVLIAGDLFESNLVADRLVEEVYAMLAARPGVPVVVLPGNHDPADGPGSIWARRPFCRPPAHVTVCTSQEPVRVGAAVILPSPLTRKRSARDPSLALVDAAVAVPSGVLKIGLTHGALAIEGKHQPEDHPIALDAASRAGLDYLAVGHWHRPLVLDGDRLVMSGTPEPDQFGQGPGSVVLAELSGPGAAPSLEMVPSGRLVWEEVPVDLTPGREAALERLEGWEAEARPRLADLVLRLVLSGSATPAARRAVRARAEALAGGCAVLQVVDRARTSLAEPYWKALLAEHPLLAQAASELEQARVLLGGEASGTPPGGEGEGAEALSLARLDGILEAAGLERADADAGLFRAAAELLAGEVAEALEGEGRL